MFSYERLSRKPSLFKSSTGLTVQQFDDIYDKEIAKRYDKYEIQRLSKRNKDRKRDIGAGRPFKLDVKGRFLMLLIYYRLYITYTLSGFLFDLDKHRLQRYSKDWETNKEVYTNSTENIQYNKKTKNNRRSWTILSRLSCFYRLYRTANSKTCR